MYGIAVASPSCQPDRDRNTLQKFLPSPSQLFSLLGRAELSAVSISALCPPDSTGPEGSRWMRASCSHPHPECLGGCISLLPHKGGAASHSAQHAHRAHFQGSFSAPCALCTRQPGLHFTHVLLGRVLNLCSSQPARCQLFSVYYTAQCPGLPQMLDELRTRSCALKASAAAGTA